jgi:glycosyltransferase involved in cell wall biosynthesis
MLLSNAYRPDPRVERESQALAQLGHQVTIICWDRQGELPDQDNINGVEIIRIKSVKSVYGAGWRQLLHIPRFWRQAIRISLPIHPQVVHCHDLDTLYAGWQIKKKLGGELVYDAHEHFPALMSLYLPKILVKALAYGERYLLRYVDATITASSVLQDEFTRYGYSPVVTIGNYPDIQAYQSIQQEDIDSIRSSLHLSRNQLLVAYIGGFSRNRALMPLIEVAERLPEVQIHLWGDGHQKEQIEKATKQHSNIRYHGWLPYRKVPLYMMAADIIYYCLRLDYPGAIYNAPNTLTQAMAAGRPILANNVGDLGRIINETNCGLLIKQPTPDEIAASINLLKDPHLRQKLGANGAHYAQTTYNTNAIKDALSQIYFQLSEEGSEN